MSGYFSSLLAEEGSDGWRAEECLRRLDELTRDDLARTELAMAAQTFALLAIVDALTDPLLTQTTATQSGAGVVP